MFSVWLSDFFSAICKFCVLPSFHPQNEQRLCFDRRRSQPMMFLFSHVCDAEMTLCSRQLGAVAILLGYCQSVSWAQIFQIPCCCTELCTIPLCPFESHGYFYPMKGNPCWVLVLGALVFLTPNLRDLECLFVRAENLQLMFQCNQSALPQHGANHRLNLKIWDWLA